MYKIAHIADTHIRNLKYHYEYKEVFKELYKSLEKERPDIIVHCGDIAHTKTQLSPEFFELCSEFLNKLGDIAPTYIILGNHDGNLKNEGRQDAITPVVEAIKNKNVYLLKKSGETLVGDDLCLNVLSVFDRDNWIDPTDESKINIALYHGSITGCFTSTGWEMDNGEDTIRIFNEFDYALLGDIHKPQALDKDGKIRYAGSTVQQNFGEDPRKGYLMWEIENKQKHKVRLISLANPRPFLTIQLNQDGTLPKQNVPKGCRLRLVATSNLPPIKLKRACDFAKVQWKPHSVSFVMKNSMLEDEAQSFSGAFKSENLRDITVQEKYIKEYIKDVEVSDEIIEKVMKLNKKYNKIVEQNEEVSRNVVWKINQIKWDNLFNYGKSNEINFRKLNGLVGIFGKNYSGKSSIVDSVLFGMFNSTSKGERKNVHIINQNKESATVTVDLQAGKDSYKITRNLNKYTRNLKGNKTIEAKADLDFSKVDGDSYESLNGTTRNETDLNVRKHFGTLDDFLLTSMASQIDSLSFIKEGSTKRKEIIAKFLDLHIFDHKFKLAKKDAVDVRALVRRYESKNFQQQIENNKELLNEIKEIIDNQRQNCQIFTKSIEKRKVQLKEVDDLISSIPAEIIDIIKVKSDIASKEEDVRSLLKKNIDLRAEVERSKEFIEEYHKIMQDLDIDNLLSLQQTCDQHQKEKEQYIIKMREQTQRLESLQGKAKLLEDIPCGNSFPDCKFICDANKSSKLVPPIEQHIEDLINWIKEFEEKIDFINPQEVEANIEKYNKFNSKIELLEKQSQLDEMEVSSNKDKLNLWKNEIKTLKSKEEEYEQNREAIENLETLGREKKAIEKKLSELESDYSKCNNKLQEHLIEQGSANQILKQLQKEKEDYADLEKEWIAYDLFMQCMHPNGISYNIIKDKLPLINAEIAKILANIVDFEVFFENTSQKLGIYIKHPYFDHRPLSMGSGAEKTLASMAIRLALISITNLPKSELFILDEPATALDQEHMEGFIRLLDMIKNQFKTVILISHLDSLKDVVDMSIDIQKKDSYARVKLT